jgi:hypothetical protein
VEPLASPSPGAEYARRLALREQEQADLSQRYAALRRGRNFLLGLLVILAVLAEHETWRVKLALVGVPALLMAFLDHRRKRIGEVWRWSAGVADFYRQRLACVEERWTGTGQPGTHYLDEAHPYAPDLDLFGPGCLFERLCTARTRPGQDTLARWLLHPATAGEVRARQAAVAELRDQLDLREDLALLADAIPAGVDFAPLAEWSAAPPTLASRGVRTVVIGSAALLLAALAAYLFLATSPLPVLAALVLQGLLLLVLRRRLAAIVQPVLDRSHRLAPLAALLARLERVPFTSPLLQRLHASLLEGPASRRVGRLGRMLDFILPADLFLARAQLALLLDDWRAQGRASLGRWLEVLGEVEALASLAAYAFENPLDPFPEVVDGPACFDALGLGHPLIPRARCVTNDVALGAGVRLLVVSGSNMSGKSTLLRSIGSNVVLALAGGPVRARRLNLTSLVVGATLRIQDSLQAGRSRFYAEVLRVRQLLDLARGSPALLFLLDELFQGTNSDDRRVGAEAILRRLVDAGALGLVTTHDLALTGVADRLGERAANVHFEDSFADGAMTFDYRMKPGVVQSSNGLALMRAVGIEV